MNKINELIQKYNKIIIFRHNRPDVDALGSQFGLYHAIKNTYPNKELYVVGDENQYRFLGSMDNITDDIFENSLSIICDVQVSHLVADNRYSLSNELIIIDHHNNDTNIDNAYVLKDTSYGSCAELVFEFLNLYKYKINTASATSLLAGMITDTNRFLYSSVNARTFKNASLLMALNADLQFIYDNLYIEDLESKKLKAYFTNKFEITSDNVAYMINDKEEMERLNKDTFYISRGMVNIMAGIDGINIWANFTYDKEKDLYLAELRSKKIVIVDIAKKYGGGGHDNACGASLPDLATINLMIEDLNTRAKENR